MTTTTNTSTTATEPAGQRNLAYISHALCQQSSATAHQPHSTTALST